MKGFITQEGIYYESESRLSQNDIEIEKIERERHPAQVQEPLSVFSKIQLTPVHLWAVIVISSSIVGTYYTSSQRITATENAVKDIRIENKAVAKSLNDLIEKLETRIDELDRTIFVKVPSSTFNPPSTTQKK